MAYKYNINIDELRRLALECQSVSEILVKMGKVEQNTYFRRHIYLLAKKNNISLPRGVKKSKRTKELDELLVIGSSPSSAFKSRLIKSGLLKEKCYLCGIGPEWKGAWLSLHLDHINGQRNDNRIENLRILCPNCHSQTTTYCAKNVKNKNNIL